MTDLVTHVAALVEEGRASAANGAKTEGDARTWGRPWQHARNPSEGRWPHAYARRGLSRARTRPTIVGTSETTTIPTMSSSKCS